MPKRVPFIPFLEEAHLQRAIQGVEEHRNGHGRFQRRRAGAELAQRDLRGADGSGQPQHPAQGLVHECQPHRGQGPRTGLQPRGETRETLTAFVRRGRWVRVAAGADAADELADEQGITPRLYVDLRQGVVADTKARQHRLHQLIGGMPGQAVQVDSQPETLPRHRLDHLPKPGADFDIRVTQRPDHEQWHPDGQMSQVPDQVEADGIGLVQVTEDQEDRPRASQVGQELDNGRDEIEMIVAQIGCWDRTRGPQGRHEP
jgi:hypothetical protein